MNDIFNARRLRLEQAVVDSALELSAHMGSDAFYLPVPNTSPSLFVALSSKRLSETLKGDAP